MEYISVFPHFAVLVHSVKILQTHSDYFSEEGDEGGAAHAYSPLAHAHMHKPSCPHLLQSLFCQRKQTSCYKSQKTRGDHRLRQVVAL